MLVEKSYNFFSKSKLLLEYLSIFGTYMQYFNFDRVFGNDIFSHFILSLIAKNYVLGERVIEVNCKCSRKYYGFQAKSRKFSQLNLCEPGGTF